MSKYAHLAPKNKVKYCNVNQIFVNLENDKNYNLKKATK
jgi:hypothetical protein